jgi:hypothetical protein
MVYLCDRLHSRVYIIDYVWGIPDVTQKMLHVKSDCLMANVKIFKSKSNANVKIRK